MGASIDGDIHEKLGIVESTKMSGISRGGVDRRGSSFNTG